MSKIRAILMDIDGTLTNNEKKIPPKTKEVLLKAQENGVLLILASGRPTSGLMGFAKELKMDEHNGLLVCFNGSRVVNAQTGEVLFNQPMTVEEGKAVLEHMKKFDRVRPMIDKGEYMYVTDVFDCWIDFRGKPFNVTQYESRGGNYKLCEVDDLAEFADYEINKILTFSDPSYLQEHYQEMMEPFKDTLSCMFTGPFYFEFTAKGIDKAKALDSVLPAMGYAKDELIAFGDGQNDQSMLEYCGIGVAMENAVDSLKAIADEITTSNNEEGIAVSLLKHMPELAE